MIHNKNFINWREVSRLLAGNPHTVRADCIPEKYRAKLNELLRYLEYWKNKPNNTWEKD